MPFIKQDKPFVVPTTDGKLIEEHFGQATNGQPELSVAHMIAPAGWSEPFQNPQFDEYTLVVKGKKLFEVDEQKIEVSAGESIKIAKGSRVRYSNPFDEPCEYWSICLPAFSMDTVNREAI
ncbi:MAG: cupin domain-containing protein [Ferruginibacter sp.]